MQVIRCQVKKKRVLEATLVPKSCRKEVHVRCMRWQCPVDLTHHAAPEIFIDDNMESHLLIAHAAVEIFISDIIESYLLIIALAVLVMVILTPQGTLTSAAHLSMKPHKTVRKPKYCTVVRCPCGPAYENASKTLGVNNNL